MQGLPARRVDLPGGSPLIVVTEVLLATPPLGSSADTALAHLLGIPSFGQSASPQDRRWPSWSRTGLPALVFGSGLRQGHHSPRRPSRRSRLTWGTGAI